MKRSTLTLVALPAALLALIVLPFVIYRDELPGSIATHWGPSGAPNGSMPLLLALVLLAGVFAAMVYAVRRVLRATPDEGPSFVAGLYAVGGLLASVSWMMVLANRDRSSWEEAGEVGPLHIVLILVAGLASGYLGWLLAGGKSSVRSVGSAPTLDIAEPQHAVWSGRGIGKVTLVIGVAVIIIALITWGLTAIVLVLAGIVAMAFAEVRATVGESGVVVSLGWWGYPTWTVPMESIARAEVEMVNPMAYGGWGYRVRPGVRAVVVRNGEGLRLVREGTADLVLTVDDAGTGAGLVNAMLATPKS